MRLYRPELYKPMTPGAGAFLVCVGIAILVGVLFAPSASANVLLAGFGVGIAALVTVAIIGRKRGLPRPTNFQLVAIWIPIIAEMVVFFLIFPHITLDERGSTLAVIAVVGAHFLPMFVSVGPLILWLGLSCIGVAIVGALAPQIPTAALIEADGALKLAFGLSMLGGLLRTSPARAAL